MDHEVGGDRDRLTIAEAGRENPRGDNLHGLFFEVLTSSGEHRGFINMAILADDAVHLDVVPGTGTGGGRLRRGLNDGAAILLAGAQGLGIWRG